MATSSGKAAQSKAGKSTEQKVRADYGVSKNKIIRFYGQKDPETAWLSNFYPCKAVIYAHHPSTGQIADAIVCGSVEAAFQASKFVESDLEYAIKIARQKSAKEAKRMGSKRGCGGRAIPVDWDTGASTRVMQELLEQKFDPNMNPELYVKLMSTDGFTLIEASPRDYNWGEGASGYGQNMLGRLIVRVRKDLKQKMQPEPETQPEPVLELTINGLPAPTVADIVA